MAIAKLYYEFFWWKMDLLLLLSLIFFIKIENVRCLVRTKLDFDWKFNLGDVPNPQEVVQPDYDDSSWRSLNIPHDFVVEGTFDEHASQSHGYLPFNLGWYRKKFTLEKESQDKYLWIDFDGAQRNTDVYLNGKLILNHLSGYTPFQVFLSEISTAVNYGGENVLVCKVDATDPDGWWYDGGGIYRSVWLNEVDNLHQTPWGIFVKSTVEKRSISFSTGTPKGSGKVEVETEIENFYDASQSFVIKATIYDSGHSVVATVTSQQYTLSGKEKKIFTLPALHCDSCHLWDIDSPYLYTMQTEVLAGGGNQTTVDLRETTFGIRTIRFDPIHGFFLNERATKIKGVANHQDFAGLGVAVPDNMQTYRVQRMKDMGANAWRTAHNPPNIALLDACDVMGMLVWDENHRNDNSTDMRADLEKLILRDRNHPSIIMWSLCNEALCEDEASPRAEAVGRSLKEIILKFDKTRPVTAAMNYGYDSGLSNVLDIQGFNYNIGSIYPFHEKRPDQPIICSETSSAYSDRGEYTTSKEKSIVSEYDVNWPGWGASAMVAWQEVHDNEFVSGEFVWTGFDYKGEPTPYKWPNINSHFGIIDMCGFPKERYYYYQVVWHKEPSIWVYPHWTWTSKEGEEDESSIVVWVYSNCPSVELFINGKSQGKKDMKINDHVEWKVTYSPGVLSAIGYDESGKAIANVNRTTTGEVVGLDLEVDFGASGITANQQDVALVKVVAVDDQGRHVPVESSKQVTFTTTGPGTVVGTGNGNPNCHESDKSNKRTLFNGLARVIVQATDQPGDIVLTASTPGLPDATVTIKSTRE